MTPAARLAAAAELLDAILAGRPAEQALTGWARRSRFAGSADRAAVRDIVFDALRRRRSFAALGGAESGRGLALGWLRHRGEEPDAWFTGDRHALAPLSASERATPDPPEGLAALDCPDWLAPRLRQSLGAAFAPVMRALQARAGVHLRVNLARIDRPAARARLAADGVETAPHPLADTALEVTAGARRVRQTAAFAEGLVELQDAASQAVSALIPLPEGPVLDWCAGGGGKALALAARGARVLAHDADPARMADLPARAARAGAGIRPVTAEEARARGPFGLVVADVPCSGSGAWRRSPEAKWRLTEAALARLRESQAAILAEAAGLVAPGGGLAYVTCSLLACENARPVDAFLAERPAWHETARHRFTPLDGGDGFFLALLARHR